ncbi:MAG: multiheme c-type cytochrome [Planctomycetota bacterium]|nr:multiheme c-type cytochrome [Planctomycetota bacterium]
MNGRLHLAALPAVLLAAAGLAALALLLKPPSAQAPLRIVSSEQCLECHSDVAAEWQASHHAVAFTNPEVRKLSNDFANQECIACHAPRPVLDFAPGERVLARQSNRGSGVDCLACHLGPDGGVATSNPRPLLDAPCRPRFEGRMASVDHCAACHNQHLTVEQWRASPAERRGENCLHCHMPETFRAGGRRGRDHSFRASHDLAALQSAVTLRGGLDPDGAWVEVENSGAAHNFPTDERSRAADVQVRWADANGAWGEWQKLFRFRQPYRDETHLVDTQLPAAQTWTGRPAAPQGASAGEARLLYRTNPYLPDDAAKELHRVPLKP